jgi:hypothetical protein
MKQTKSIALVLALVLGLQSLSGCFGKFALVKAVYNFNDDLAAKDLTGRVIKSLIFFVLVFVPVYQVAGFVDWIILNVIEFWTGTNPLAMKAGQTETQFATIKGKTYQMVATQGQMIISEMNGTEIKKSTVLYFDNQTKTVSVMNGTEMVKVADIRSTTTNFATTSASNLMF